MNRGHGSLWVGHRALPQGVGIGTMFLEGNPDSDSSLRNPSFVSLCGLLSETSAPDPFPVSPLQLLGLDLPSVLPQVAELQERAETQGQERAILERSLQDKAAEVEVERMSAKVSV